MVIAMTFSLDSEVLDIPRTDTGNLSYCKILTEYICECLELSDRCHISVAVLSHAHRMNQWNSILLWVAVGVMPVGSGWFRSRAVNDTVA